MKNWMYYVALAVLYAVLFVAFFHFIGKGDTNGQFHEEITSKDTVFIFDTIKIYEPTPTSERYLGIDTIRLERADKRADSLVTNDTEQACSPMSHIADTSDMAEVLLPRVQRKYEDSTCTVWVSGHNPTVDSVWVYNTKVYYPVVREKEPKPPRVVVSIGPYVGFGNKGANYGVAISVGIPIWSW